ncbi:MAG: hypothetical protein R3199_03535 [Gemmatimonadota bacterium]|nr:hypothetical protein [Gemmatimonadota bacterium]
MKRVAFVLADGRRLKGLVNAFDPVEMRSVSVREVDAQEKLIRTHDLDVQAILAAFFVDDLFSEERRGSASERETGEQAPAPGTGGRRVALTTVWGERMRGDLLPHDSRGMWYEFHTVDPKRAANLKRALLSRRAIARKRPLPDG